MKFVITLTFPIASNPLSKKKIRPRNEKNIPKPHPTMYVLDGLKQRKEKNIVILTEHFPTPYFFKNHKIFIFTSQLFHYNPFPSGFIFFLSLITFSLHPSLFFPFLQSPHLIFITFKFNEIMIPLCKSYTKNSQFLYVSLFQF